MQFASAATEILKPLKGTKQLQLNAWLLTVENSLPSMAALSALANHHKLSYSSLLRSGFATRSHVPILDIPEEQARDTASHQVRGDGTAFLGFD